MMLTNLIDIEGYEHYRLLIHSLTHEHAQDNSDRHLLLIEKWIRDNEEGYIININTIIPSEFYYDISTILIYRKG